jgi:hypothetical protein
MDTNMDTKRVLIIPSSIFGFSCPSKGRLDFSEEKGLAVATTGEIPDTGNDEALGSRIGGRITEPLN